MKRSIRTLASILCAVGVFLSAGAQNFKVPEPTLTVPIGGEAELLYNMFQVTWGYYELTENAGEDPMTCTLTMPDGSVKTVKGSIDDANMEGTIAGKAPSTVNNALSFRNFMSLNEETMQLIQQYGTFKVNIPAGIVLVNGEPNPEAELSFQITGEDTTSIKSVNTEKGNLSVYTLSGEKVENVRNEAEIKNLPHGIYIINGKKTIIK